MTLPCAAAPDDWFSTSPAVQARAVAICGMCPVRARCAELGRDEQHGVWAGEVKGAPVLESPPAFLRQRVVAPHGSHAAYQKCRDDDGRPCAICRAAHSQYVSAWRLHRRWIAPVTQPETLYVQLELEEITA